jgi:aspartyl-tRNA(Asn)/glutamyl-tRNA(Gln) amidotransferase subunit A
LSDHGGALSSFDAAFWSSTAETYRHLQANEAAAIHRGYFQHFEPVIAERLAWGASIPSAELDAFRQRLADFRSQMSALFQPFDFLIAPCAPISKLYAGHDHTESRKLILRYTTPASLAGLPAITLPGEHIGAPLGTGIQLLAAPMNDASLLAFASTLAT